MLPRTLPKRSCWNTHTGIGFFHAVCVSCKEEGSSLWAICIGRASLKAVASRQEREFKLSDGKVTGRFAPDSCPNQWGRGLDRISLPGYRLDIATYASFLHSCRKAKALSDGKHVHDHIIQSGLQETLLLENLLLQLYGKCGALEDALMVFSSLLQSDVSSWNCIIGAYTQQGQSLRALYLLDQMQQEGVFPNKHTFICILSASLSGSFLREVNRMLTRILAEGFESDIVVGTAILNLYGKHGSLMEAQRMFERMSQQNVVSWTAMIEAYARHGKCKEALHLFDQMQDEGFDADKVAFLGVLAACSSKERLSDGKRMHALICDNGFEADIVVGTTLVSMYGKCGSLDDACKMFGAMPERNVVSWTAVIAMYAEHGQERRAIQHFYQMQQEGVLPNKVTFVNIFAACTALGGRTEGMQMHVYVLSRGFESDIVVGNALVNMYGKCDNLEAAYRVFLKMKKRDVVSWNAMVAAYVEHGDGKAALELYDQMVREAVKPDRVTFISLLTACANHACLADGQHLHFCLIDFGLQEDVTVGNTLVNMYGKCGSLRDAQYIFDKMLERDIVSWTGMVSLYVQHGQIIEAFQFFGQMQQEGIMPNRFTLVSLLTSFASQTLLTEGRKMHAYIVDRGLDLDLVVVNALINMYGKCANVENAIWVFNNVREKDVASWNAMIGVHAEYGECKKAFKTFERMLKEGVLPDKVTVVSILATCASQAALAQGEQVHSYILDCGLEADTAVGNALVNLYGKCGRLENARRMFDKIAERNVLSWTAMIAVCEQNGRADEALQLYNQMLREGVTPNEVTFVSVIAACASQGALVEGEKVHICILDSKLESHIVVCNALVNMYGKCGSLEHARKVFDRMPKWDVVSWNAIIAVYSQHGQSKEALQLFGQMQQENLVPDQVTFVSILVACSRSGMVDEARRFFVSMRQDYGISPLVDHYICMIDLLGRAGMLDEAESLINDMPAQPTVESLTALLGACRYKADVERGERLANHMLELDPENAAPYVTLSNLYAVAGRLDAATSIIRRMKEKGVKHDLHSVNVN